ncbi:MAG: sigma factor, partial [Nocardioidaceae bacterium]
MEIAIETGARSSMEREQSTARAARDAEFEQYMAARQPSLLRTAYLLTGDRHSAEDLVQTSLAKLYLSWDKVQRRELVDGYVRRIMVNENNSLWRRAWKRREVTTDAVPDQVGVSDRPDHGESSALWDFVQT